MRFHSITWVTLQALLSSRVLAAVVPFFETEETDMGAEIPEGAFFSSPGYLVPAHVKPEDLDESASWMKVVNTPDANETTLTARDYEAFNEGQEFDLEARAAKWDTRISLSKITTDYGCEGGPTTIRSILGDAFWHLCSNNWCNHGDKYVRKVTWMDNQVYKKDRWVEVTATGNYYGPVATRAIVRDAVRATVSQKSVTYGERRYRGLRTGIVSQRCRMAKFTNAINISRPSPSNRFINIYMSIKLNDVEANCFAADMLAAIGGGIHASIGTALGVISVICSLG